jgi:hypothetical protein
MTDALRLPADKLHTPCRLKGLPFDTTAQLEDLPALPGQQRAREAIELGVAMRSRGYKPVRAGAGRAGQRSLVRRMLEVHAAGRPTPADWSDMTRLRKLVMRVLLDLASRQAGKVIRLARQRASVALVLPASSLSDGDEQVRLLLEESTCPLLLLL